MEWNRREDGKANNVLQLALSEMASAGGPKGKAAPASTLGLGKAEGAAVAEGGEADR